MHDRKPRCKGNAMLKYKTIRAFVAVWCAICLAYAGVRTAVGALMNADVTADEPAVASNTTAKNEEPEDAEEPIAPESQSTVPDVEQTPKSEEQPDITSEQPVEADKPEEQAGPEQADEELDDQDTWEEEEQNEQETLSLYEYLSQFTCGNCRRNCSLANPRCHNGSRLAEAKAQEYYEEMGG